MEDNRVAKQTKLGAYRDKRNPTQTTEPFSAERSRSTEATMHGDFVVHLHAATWTHYDLRLEIGGVLKSFAVPKGPSLDPDDKRLALNTEDHPLAYLDFEDVIPAGNYGAGAMIVWDTGRVVYLEGSAEDGVARGKIDFQLRGHKLKGRFGLIHTGARAKNAADRNHWLLVKKVDAFSSANGDITADMPRSVLSGMAVDELEHASERARELEERAATLGAPLGEVETRSLSPMLCASTAVTLDDDERLYELKLDGVRIVADRRGDDVSLRYRAHRLATAAYPEIARAVSALAAKRVVLDGEIVAFDDSGRPSFQLLGRRIHLTRPHDVRRAVADVPVVYMVFDLLQLGDRDLRALPLIERKRLLGELVCGKGLIRVLDHIEGEGSVLFAFCEQQDLEGLVAKRKASPYRLGPRRSQDWIKVKRLREADFVVVGWEQSDKARRLRSLLLAAYDGEKLVLRGKAGSGLDDASIDWFLERLPELAQPKCAAVGRLTKHGKRHYVRPELVVSVSFAGQSNGGSLRFPVFRGMRNDVAPEACVLSGSGEQFLDSLALSPASDDTPNSLTRAKDVAVRAKLSNQNKVFWPDEGYTKGDLCDYYASIAEALLPLLKGRPIVMVRYPDGVSGKSFYQWHVPKGTPPWLRSLQVRQEGERGKKAKRVFLIDDVDGLLHIANLGTIPIHVLAAREGSRETCDFLTVDFDIGKQPFQHAVTLALSLRELLTQIGLTGFVKTSGQSGLHVLVPLGPGVSFATARALTELLGRLLWARHPDIATMERTKERRGARIYIDTGQTGRSRTIVAPYSVRAYPGGLVSTPLFWNEIHMALDPKKLTLFSVPQRLAELGDPMRGFMDARPDVPAAVMGLGRMLEPS